MGIHMYVVDKELQRSKHHTVSLEHYTTEQLTSVTPTYSTVCISANVGSILTSYKYKHRTLRYCAHTHTHTHTATSHAQTACYL